MEILANILDLIDSYNSWYWIYFENLCRALHGQDLRYTKRHWHCNQRRT